ncbi:DUF5361 domain-containing protein [Peptostreptococcus canis]|uniref:Phage protein n=1 Tax=Peptostreptococcus canis TaxID=1159213 RepID=A0ABR6TII2_9FIRM|nr:DUF5361 domain-containing protein [Peptostreptococcus canis]MBC2575221.1 hypothetical protein [Peptostreptococcus canis]MBP1997602.1 hypothetical protein [Peptostreptococcus canis]
MISVDEDALICDLAETYRIIDYRSFSLIFISTLAAGLRDNSRIKMKIANQKIELNTMLLAGALDMLRLLFWSKTKDGTKNRNRPKSIVEILEQKEKAVHDYATFASCEDFEKERKRLLQGIKEGE